MAVVHQQRRQVGQRQVGVSVGHAAQRRPEAVDAVGRLALAAPVQAGQRVEQPRRSHILSWNRIIKLIEMDTTRSDDQISIQGKFEPHLA